MEDLKGNIMRDSDQVGRLLTPQRLPCQDYEHEKRRLVLIPEIDQSLNRLIRLLCFVQKNQCADTPLNGILLLQGPPGCGKSMTARGFAQKLAEQHLKVFGQESVVFELQVHAIFSEFLGKTSETIAQVFEMIRFSTDRRQSILIVEEMESIGFSRKRFSAGDPSDVVRAVNGLLRQVDTLKGNPKFLLIATSNSPSLLDEAFTDRADYIVNFKNPDVTIGTRILTNAANDAKRLGIATKIEDLQKVAKALCGETNGKRPSGRLLSKLLFLGYIEGGSLQPSASLLIEIAHQKMNSGEAIS